MCNILLVTKQVTCPECGYTFITKSKTGETHCGYCYSKIVFDRELLNRIRRERWRKLNSEQLERECEKRRLYYKRNRERLREKRREYYRLNAEKIKAYVKKWKEEHPNYIRNWRLLNREKVLQEKRLWYQKRKEERVKMLGGKCQICGYNKCIASLTLHHLNPEEKEREKDWIRDDFDPTKYMLLCSNCHEELHWKLKNTSLGLTLERK